MANHKTKYGLIFGAIIITILLLLGLFFRSAIGVEGGAEEFPISWFIIVAAIVGSVVNEPFRHSEAISLSGWWILCYMIWKMSVSIVFAFVLYMTFIAGLISGDMFPKFVNTTVQSGGKFVNMKEFSTIVDPESYKDVAKILVWSFIAGYSERFVPNLISQLIKGSEERSGS